MKPENCIFYNLELCPMDKRPEGETSLFHPCCRECKKKCKHTKTHYEDWPENEQIEVCDLCGMSRSLWEQGESSWKMVYNLDEVRKELQDFFDNSPPPKKIRERLNIGPVRISSTDPQWMKRIKALREAIEGAGKKARIGHWM